MLAEIAFEADGRPFTILMSNFLCVWFSKYLGMRLWKFIQHDKTGTLMNFDGGFRSLFIEDRSMALLYIIEMFTNKDIMT